MELIVTAYLQLLSLGGRLDKLHNLKRNLHFKGTGKDQCNIIWIVLCIIITAQTMQHEEKTMVITLLV